MDSDCLTIPRRASDSSCINLEVMMVQHDSSLLPLHSSRLSIQKRYDKAEKITRNLLNLYCNQDFGNDKSPMVAIPRGTNDGRAILRWIIFRGAWESCVSFNKSLRTLCLFAPDCFHLSPSFGIAAAKAEDSFFPPQPLGVVV